MESRFPAFLSRAYRIVSGKIRFGGKEQANARFESPAPVGESSTVRCATGNHQSSRKIPFLFPAVKWNGRPAEGHFGLLTISIDVTGCTSQQVARQFRARPGFVFSD
jgi:hypothetical protein